MPTGFLPDLIASEGGWGGLKGWPFSLQPSPGSLQAKQSLVGRSLSFVPTAKGLGVGVDYGGPPCTVFQGPQQGSPITVVMCSLKNPAVASFPSMFHFSISRLEFPGATSQSTTCTQILISWPVSGGSQSKTGVRERKVKNDS